MVDSKKRKAEDYLSFEEMNKSKELLLEKSKIEREIAVQVSKDLNDLESLLRSEMEKSNPLWTDTEFDKLGIRSAMEALSKNGSLFDKDIITKVDRVMPALLTFANRLPKSKAKKEVEEKRAPSAPVSGSGRSTSTSKVPKDIYDKIERLEERIVELEDKLDGYKKLERDFRKLEKLVNKSS